MNRKDEHNAKQKLLSAFLSALIVLSIFIIGIAPASAIQAGDVTLNKNVYLSPTIIGGIPANVLITVSDADLNTLPGGAENVIVQLSSTTGGTINVILDETDPITGIASLNSGVFTTNAVSPDPLPTLVTTPTNDGLNQLQVAWGDIITATYVDANPAATRITTATVGGIDGSIALDQVHYTAPGAGLTPVTITVRDNDENTNHLVAETFNVNLASGSSPAGAAVLLTETAQDSGVFTAVVNLGPAGVILAVTGDTLTATYNDAVNAAGGTSVRSANAAVVSRTGTVSIDAPTYRVPTVAPWIRGTVTLVDNDLNVNTGAADVITAVSGTVTIQSPSSGLGATGILLTETGVNTGIFTGSFDLSADTILNGNDLAGNIPSVEAANGVTITITYNDALNVNGVAATASATATVASTTGTLTLDRTSYGFGSVVTVTLVDPDMNRNPNIAEQTVGGADGVWAADPNNDQVSVTIVNVANAAADGSTALVLTETGVNTGIFKGTFQVFNTVALAGVALNDAAAPFLVASGNIINVRYRDASNSAGAVQTITATASVTTNTGTLTLDKATVSPTGTLVINVADPDVNLNPNAIETIPAASVTVETTAMFAPAAIPLPLTETGANTGVFTGRVTLTGGAGAYPADNGDTVTITYIDAADVSGNVQNVQRFATARNTAGSIVLDKTSYGITDTVIVTLTDQDLNVNPDIADVTNVVPNFGGAPNEGTGRVTVSTTRELTEHAILFTETGPNTGVFSGSFRFVQPPGATVGQGTANLQKLATRGDVVTVLYHDADDAAAVAVDASATASIISGTGVIQLNRAKYPLTGQVIITLTDADLNSDSVVAETILLDPATGGAYVTLRTNRIAQVNIQLTETGVNTGVFTNTNPINLGTAPFALIRNNDGLTATYNDAANAQGSRVTTIATANIAMTTGSLALDKPVYFLTDTAMVTVSDPDLDANSQIPDNINVNIRTTSDQAGINLLLTETGANTAVFTGNFTFTTGVSAGTRIRASTNDTVTVLYVDQTPTTTKDTIAASDWIQIYASANIGVAQPLSTIIVAPASVTLNVSQTQQFTATGKDAAGNTVTATFTWASSNPTVGTVSTTGLFTAVANGTTTVTATSGTISGSATVTVVSVQAGALATITVTPTSATLNVTQTQAFTAVGKDAAGNVVAITPTWTSSNLTVGTVTSTGLFTALANGTTTVTATSGTISGTATVRVGVSVVDMYRDPATGKVEKPNAIQALNDYLFAGTISKPDAVAVLNAYLFGG